MSENNFEASGHNVTKLVHVMCREAGMNIWVLFWGACSLKICGRTTCHDFGQF